VSKAEHIYGEDDLDSDPDLEALPKLQELLEALANKFADMDLNDMQIDRQVDCNKATVQGIIAIVHKTCFDTDQISQKGFWKNAGPARQRNPWGNFGSPFFVFELHVWKYRAKVSAPNGSKVSVPYHFAFQRSLLDILI